MGNVFMQSRHFVYGVVICRDVAFHKKMTKNGGFMHFNKDFLFCPSI